jgi:hypothetical protein
LALSESKSTLLAKTDFDCWRGDHGSPCQIPERNPAAFAGVGSGPIRVLACVSELVEIRIVRWLAGGKSKSNGESVIRIISSHIGFWIAGKPIVRLNRYACRDP